MHYLTEYSNTYEYHTANGLNTDAAPCQGLLVRVVSIAALSRTVGKSSAARVSPHQDAFLNIQAPTQLMPPPVTIDKCAPNRRPHLGRIWNTCC